MAAVKYIEATCRYPGSSSEAVASLDLDVRDGEFMVLVGPSGSGKSTALRMLAGLEEIASGEIRIDDVDITDRPPKDRDVAMVFQNYALYPHMNVADNMGFALKLQGVSKAERVAKVLEAAKLLDLTDLLDRKPKQLSGGQRQRVAMGRAIVREPRVFLMDEPLSNLDAKLRVETRANIAMLQTRLGTTTVYVTHDQVEAMTMGDRVAVLKNGVLQQCDTPRTLYEAPANAFVASFIGSPAMNLRTARLTADGAYLSASTVPLTGPAVNEAQTAGLDNVLVGVRPEALVLGDNGTTAPLLLEVALVEELGADAYIYGRLTDDSETDRQFVARWLGSVLPQRGDRVALTFSRDDAHIFNPDTGVRIAGR
jgi:multiple sugar transport system ATP-binding protein